MKLKVVVVIYLSLLGHTSSGTSICNVNNNQYAPVNIKTGNVIQGFSSQPLTFTICNNENFQITNTGQAAIITSAQSTTRTSVTGGPLGTSQFKLYSIQFFWSQDYTEPCCYSVDKSNSPFNIQIVYWDTKYGCYENAYKGNGIFVTRVPITVEGTTSNPKFNTLESILRNISTAGSSYIINGNVRDTIFAFFDIKSVNYQNYYFYQGAYIDPSQNSTVPSQAIYAVGPKANTGFVDVCQFTSLTGLKTSSGTPIAALDLSFGPTTKIIKQYSGLREIII